MDSSVSDDENVAPRSVAAAAGFARPDAPIV
jgi:hypothetical protein